MALSQRSLRLISFGEMASYIAGGVIIAFFAVQLAQGEVERQSGITSFEESRSVQVAMIPSDLSAAALETAAVQFDDQSDSMPDTTLWAPARVADYQASLRAELPRVLGVLEMPDLALKVPVYPTDSELAMDRGAGVIDGMSYPHEPGNIGIAGHRDGYFRVLKDAVPGQRMTLQTLEGTKHFIVDSVKVIEIADTSVLQDTDQQTVTLVTCYPFYFVGHAPQRFIVTASLDTTYVNQ